MSYTRLSALMASHPEVMVLRRFRHLNVQNLLYLQAELTREERILRELEERDAGSGIPERETYSRDWGRLSGSDTTQEGDSLQWRKFLQVRELLKEYNSLLLQTAQLAGIPGASGDCFAQLQEWMERPQYGNDFALRGNDDSWNTNDRDEFLVPGGQHIQVDRLSRYISKCVLYLMTKLRPAKTIDAVYEFRDSRSIAVADGLSTIIASIVPTLSILVLYSIHRMWIRVGLVIVFTTVFAGVLAFTTNARRVEVFGAATAFAAVEVVFIGSTALGNAN